MGAGPAPPPSAGGQCSHHGFASQDTGDGRRVGIKAQEMRRRSSRGRPFEILVGDGARPAAGRFLQPPPFRYRPVAQGAAAVRSSAYSSMKVAFSCLKSREVSRLPDVRFPPGCRRVEMRSMQHLLHLVLRSGPIRNKGHGRGARGAGVFLWAITRARKARRISACLPGCRVRGGSGRAWSSPAGRRRGAWGRQIAPAGARRPSVADVVASHGAVAAVVVGASLADRPTTGWTIFIAVVGIPSSRRGVPSWPGSARSPRPSVPGTRARTSWSWGRCSAPAGGKEAW